MCVIDRIISELKSQGFTQIDLANHLKEKGVTKQTITDWKSGKSTTYYQLIVEIADFLGVTTDYLLRGIKNTIEKGNCNMELMHVSDDTMNSGIESTFKELEKRGKTIPEVSEKTGIPVDKLNSLKTRAANPIFEEYKKLYEVIESKFSYNETTPKECTELYEQFKNCEKNNECSPSRKKIANEFDKINRSLAEIAALLKVNTESMREGNK